MSVKDKEHISVLTQYQVIRLPCQISSKCQSVISFPMNNLPTRVCCYKLTNILRHTADRRCKGMKTGNESKNLTCEAEGAVAGVLWGGCWLTYCSTCGSIQTDVWFHQAGIADILAKLSNPSWGTNTLQENSIILVKYRCSVAADL